LKRKAMEVKIRNYTKEAELWKAISEGMLGQAIRLICDHVIDANWADAAHDRSIFYRACFFGHSNIVALLIRDRRVDINRAQKEGATPLFVACQNGHLEIVNMLLEDSRVDPMIPLRDGTCPFYVACQEGHLEIISRMLKDPRINTEAPREDGATPLYIACEIGHTEVVKLLLEDDRVDPAKPRLDGATPIFIAAQNGHLEVIRHLLAGKKKVDLDAKWRNITAIEQAQRNDRKDVVQLLQAYQVDSDKVRQQLRKQLGICARNASDTFALIVFLCDEYLAIKSAHREGPTCRFLKIAQQLPLDAQMVLSNRLFGLESEIVPLRLSEESFKRTAKVSFS